MSVHSRLSPASASTPGTSPNLRAQEGGGDVIIRPLATTDEYVECVAIQSETWGAEYDERVPPALLQVAAKIGGLVIGAFAPGGGLQGFVFSLAGEKDGERVHWSHMLAVRANARGAGIGRLLKEYQRAELARRGVTRLYWTFDPLQARNAHLNVNRLGVEVIDYVVDMYGTSRSPLHFGIPTDRLVVMWRTDAPRHVTASDDSHLPILTGFPQPGDNLLNGDQMHATSALIEIPLDVQRVVDESPAIAAAWRASSREHFQWAIRHGFAVTALRRDAETKRAFYVIARDGPTNSAS
jgi:predicted GNAT superfamily acetyltransferase